MRRRNIVGEERTLLARAPRFENDRQRKSVTPKIFCRDRFLRLPDAEFIQLNSDGLIFWGRA
jgi:hypothetical protein